jgi:outer membrane protein assembly factor BamA
MSKRTPVLLLATFQTLTLSAQHLISSIELKGNKKTKPVTILRELTFQEGDQIDTALFQEEIQKSKVNLINVNLFNEVLIDYKVDGKLVSVNIDVQEKWYIWPIPFLEFADRNFNQWWDFNLDPSRMNYGLYYFQYNVLGRNQTLKISLVNGYSRNLGIYYRIPNLGKEKQWNLITEHWYKSNEEVWYKSEENRLQFFSIPGQTSIERFKNSVELEFRPGWRKTHSFSLYRRTTQVADTLITSNLNPGFTLSSDPQYHFWNFLYSYRKDNRDNRFFPMEGNYTQLDAGLNLVQDQGVFYNLAAEYNYYKPLASGFFLSTGFKAAYRSSYRLPYDLTRMLGYDFIVRGYESYVMEGHAFGLARFTLSKALIHDKLYHVPVIPIPQYRKLPVGLYTYLLADYGYVQNDLTASENDMTNRHLFGYGIGLGGVFYYDKVFRFEYSLNDLGQGGVKIHFEKAF